MLHPEPDSSTIDAWLAGTLSPGETEALEGWLEQHPEFLDEEIVELDPVESLTAPAPRNPDPTLTALIDRISGEAVPLPTRRDTEAWKEVLTPGADPDSPGSIGPYEIVELIAVAGMGIVFKARDPELDRIAALKVLSPDLASNATARERFLREARAAASLEHENILPIYGVHDEAIPFFAMRHAGGGTLQEKLDQRKFLEIEEIKSIGWQVAAALHAAHEKGIVHRDIKPANILFDENGSGIWVCDFGIARCAEDPSLTYPGAIAGTPRFMSPEQAAGRPVDGRSDLYSLGAVLYQCAYGRSLHSGETTVSVLRKLGEEGETRPDTRGRTLPRFLRRLISSLLSHDPADRPASAKLVVDAFENETAPSPKRHVRSRRKWIAALLASGLVLGLLQVPAVKRMVNHSLALRKPQSFSIDGRLGIYSRLESVVEAAKPGETIRLSSENPLEVDNLRIPPDKPLHFAPSRSGKPIVLTTGIPGAPGMISESELFLSGLKFQMNPKRDGDGIVIMQGADLTLENCEFHFSPKRPLDFGDYTNW